MSKQDDFMSGLAARVVLLEQQKHKMESQIQTLEAGLDAALVRQAATYKQ